MGKNYDWSRDDGMRIVNQRGVRKTRSSRLAGWSPRRPKFINLSSREKTTHPFVRQKFFIEFLL